jgi:hypothetical protein
MDHYFYHCERNPDGFALLKVENFEKNRLNEFTKKRQRRL